MIGLCGGFFCGGSWFHSFAGLADLLVTLLQWIPPRREGDRTLSSL